MAKTNSYFKIDNICLDDYVILENGKKKYVSLFSNSYEKFVFFAIERFGNNSEAFPSQLRLSQVLLCSKSQIEKTLRKLKEKGLIFIVKNKNRKTNTYLTCNLEKKYLEVFGPRYVPSKKKISVPCDTNNKELNIKNNNKKTKEESSLVFKDQMKKIEDILSQSEIKMNDQSKINILKLAFIKGITAFRVKEVILYVEKFKKGVGFLYNALKFDWELKSESSNDKKLKSIDEQFIEIEKNLLEKERLKMNDDDSIQLTMEEEREALILARKEGLSFEFLEIMKKRAKNIYIRTLKNLLNRK